MPILAKARVIEIYHASQLWYAATYYPIPLQLETGINKLFVDYITFPKRKKNEISTREMQKLREDGGIKFIQIKSKSETPKVSWLIRMITDENLKINRLVFNELIKKQKGRIEGEEVIFTDQYFTKNVLKTNSPLYDEALKAISKLDVWKHITDIKNEPVFYNPVFMTVHDSDFIERTIKPFVGKNESLLKIKTYGDLLQAERTQQNPKLKNVFKQKIRSIQIIRDSAEKHKIKGIHEEMEFKDVTEKFIYGELISIQSRDHVYQSKWLMERGDETGMIEWDTVWKSVHNTFFTEEIKSTIWEQIHLNFYTTYNYMKWHNSLIPCPLCNKIPEDIFHIILDCKFTRTMWKTLETILIKIVPLQISAHEMAFGLQTTRYKDKCITLRNWLTYNLRHCIMKEERKAHYRNTLNHDTFIMTFWNKIAQKAKEKELYYKHVGREKVFQDIITTNNVIARKNRQGIYEIECL